MRLRRFDSLRRHTGGATIIEFALVAPVALMLIIGILQAGIQLWRWQALQSTAIDAARCAGINSASCQQATLIPANTASYAVTAAALRGLSQVVSSDVTVSTGTTAQTNCGGTTATVVSVTLSHNFGTIFLVTLPSTLTASACYPLIVD